jgi:hypothetical protein
MRAILPFFLCFAVACGGDKDSDTTAGDADTDADADADADADTDSDVEGTQVDFELVDLLAATPVEGMDLETDIDSDTSDANGMASVKVTPDMGYEIVGTHPDYFDHIWVGYGANDHSHSTNLVSRSAGVVLGTLLGLTIDPAKGVVVVTLSDGAGNSLAGATVSTSASYDVALVADSASATGFSPGTTTLAGSDAWVIFINVDPGDIDLDVTSPNKGDSCVYLSSDVAADAAVSAADSVTNVRVDCMP